ncbi:MAG: 3-hydroxyacyl-ACP dehydratase FabZ family protein [Mariniblastus sp.]
MKYFEHKFDKVEDYLHHRSPYLLVEKIKSIEPTEIVAETKLTGDEFFIAGHFPGAPILPGAMMQEMTTQTAGCLIAAKYNPMEQYNTTDPFFNEYALGVLVKVKNARYRGFARPGDTLEIKVTLSEQFGQVFDFVGTISVGDKTIVRNSFQLTNILSSVLQGN